jgi:hypothetical protein
MTDYRRLTREEISAAAEDLMRAAQYQMAQHYGYYFFGPSCTKLDFLTYSEYDDEGSYYPVIDEIIGYDSANNVLPYGSEQLFVDLRDYFTRYSSEWLNKSNQEISEAIEEGEGFWDDFRSDMVHELPKQMNFPADDTRWTFDLVNPPHRLFDELYVKV